MWASIIYLIVAFIIARTLSAYHPAFVFKSYFEVKNSFLAFLLIDKSIIKRSVKGDFDTHKNKITLAGVVFYCLTAVAAIVGLIVLFAVPEVPIESFDMGKYAFYGNTANEHFVACLIGSLLFTGIALYFLNIINVDTSCRSARRMSKIANVVLLILCALLAIISFAGMITNIDLLIFD